jgi:nitrate reductase NapE component
MIWVLVVLAAVMASEAMLRLPLIPRIRSVIDVSQKSVRVLGSKRISDHWKERVLPSYSKVMARDSIAFFLFLCMALLPVVALGLVFPGGVAAWLAALMRPLVIGVLCLVSVAYIWLRLKVSRV